MATYTLRPYQKKAVESALSFAAESVGLPHRRRCYTAPTGTGKGTIQLDLLSRLESAGIRAWFGTPSLEIIRGTLPRIGVEVPASAAKLTKVGIQHHISTPLTLLNRVLKGEIEAPDVILADEVHEWVGSNNVPGDFFATLSCTPIIGFTATPYRGTPKGTQEFLDAWGSPVEILTLEDAIRDGWLSFPSFRIEPLVDDDLIQVRNGDFTGSGANNAYVDRVEGLATLIGEYCPDGHYPTPTMVSVPGQKCARALLDQCHHYGIPALAVTQKTSGPDRQTAYARAQAGEVALIQISVLTRGADLPKMKRLIDAQPTMSPVRWMQTIGRVMRPGAPAEVVVTNRNLERHCMLLQGCVPPAYVRKAQDAFDSPSWRGGARSLGLEDLSRHTAACAPLKSGGYVQAYSLTVPSITDVVREFCCLLLPGVPDPLWATRERQKGFWCPIRRRPIPTYAKWRTARPEEIPTEFVGFSSRSGAPATSKQMSMWNKRAEFYGIDKDRVEKVTRREIDCLAVLMDLGLKVE